MKYIYYKTDGTKEVIETKEPISLKAMQKLVGGFIEIVQLRNGHTLMVNEDGYINKLPYNPHFIEEDVLVDLGHSNGRLCGNVIEGQSDKDGEFIIFSGVTDTCGDSLMTLTEYKEKYGRKSNKCSKCKKHYKLPSYIFSPRDKICATCETLKRYYE